MWETVVYGVNGYVYRDAFFASYDPTGMLIDYTTSDSAGRVYLPYDLGYIVWHAYGYAYGVVNTLTPTFVFPILSASTRLPSPKVTFIGGGGTGAAAQATESVGYITGFVVASGFGYTSPPTASLAWSFDASQPLDLNLYTNRGEGQSAIAVLTGGGVSSLTVVGEGYTFTQQGRCKAVLRNDVKVTDDNVSQLRADLTDGVVYVWGCDHRLQPAGWWDAGLLPLLGVGRVDL